MQKRERRGGGRCPIFSHIAYQNILPHPNSPLTYYLLPTCVLHSSLSSGPATSYRRKLMGFLSDRLSLVGFTTASTCNIAMSPALHQENKEGIILTKESQHDFWDNFQGTQLTSATYLFNLQIHTKFPAESEEINPPWLLTTYQRATFLLRSSRTGNGEME